MSNHVEQEIVPSYIFDKICTIVPNVHLDLTRSHRRFMALTHAADNPHYLTFFKMRANEGRYVILDNSTVELGQPEATTQYLEKAKRMHAKEIVAPDYLHDMPRTLKALDAFMETPGVENFHVMAVPQGRTQEEWIECVARMSAYPIHTIGISRRYMPMFGTGRLFACALANNVLATNTERKVGIHLLGCQAYPEVDVRPCLALSYVTGVDSSLAALNAKMDRSLVDTQPRPPGMINVIDDVYDPTLLNHNIHNWVRLCGGNLDKVERFHR